MAEDTADGAGAVHDALDGELDEHRYAYEEAVDPDDGGDEVTVGWRNSALEVQAFIDADDPHASYLQILVTDLGGELGAVEWPLGPLQVRALQRQLEDVRETQAYAEWVADGGHPEDFVAAPADLGPDFYTEQQYDDQASDGEVDTGEPAPIASRARRAADPMNVPGLMDRAPLVFGFKLQTVLLAAAVLFGVLVILLGWVA